MDFFVPSTSGPQQAESVYSSIATHVSAPVEPQRIFKLEWQHEGTECSCEVGQPLPEIFRSSETVLAIFDCGDVFKICTPNRGAIKFDPIHAVKASVSNIEYFS